MNRENWIGFISYFNASLQIDEIEKYNSKYFIFCLLFVYKNFTLLVGGRSNWKKTSIIVHFQNIEIFFIFSAGESRCLEYTTLSPSMPHISHKPQHFSLPAIITFLNNKSALKLRFSKIQPHEEKCDTIRNFRPNGCAAYFFANIWEINGKMMWFMAPCRRRQTIQNKNIELCVDI